MIFDTDILIWFLRGNEKAAKLVEDSMPFSISIITYMELLQGMRNKQEKEKMKKAFKEMDVNIIPINEHISILASNYVDDYALSDSMQLADALIATTCVQRKDVLFTANDKHYKAVEDIQLNVFRP